MKESAIQKLNPLHIFHFILADDHEPEQPILRIIRRVIRIIIGAVKKFMGDEGILRAASVSYSVIVSFIPSLIVVFLVGNRFFDFDRYKVIIREFIRKNNLPFQPDPYFEVFDQLLLNADKVTGVALVVILFSATAVLRNLENALNRVWQVRAARPWMQKISGFLFVLILGPGLMTVGLSTGQSYVKKAAPPDIHRFKVINKQPVLLGSQGLYLKKEKEEWISAIDFSSIDFEAQKDPVLISEEENRLLSPEEVQSVRAVLAKIDKTAESDMNRTSFSDIAVVKNKQWLITGNGNLLFSKDGGKYWTIQKFQQEKMKLLFPVQFSKIYMHTETSGFILGKSGLILTTQDGENWKPAYLAGLHENINDVAKISGDSYIAVGDSFTVLHSSDGGQSWNILSSAKRLKKKEAEDLHDVFIKGSDIWIAGDMGLILHSSNGGASWERKGLGMKNVDFYTIAFSNSKSGIVAGDEGAIRFTSDGGQTWKKMDADTDFFFNHLSYYEGNIWLAANAYHLLKLSPDYSSLTSELSPALVRKLAVALGNFILPFSAIWIAFFLIYKIMPFTVVSNRAAAWGAVSTSLLWVSFLWIYKSYSALFTKGTLALYGTLAAIPVTLILVYTSAAIIVFGAEVGFFVQFPETLRLGFRKASIETDKQQIWYAFRFLQIIFENFDKGKGATKEEHLLKACANDINDFYIIMNKFLELDIIEKTENGRFLPVKSANALYIKDLIEVVDPVDYAVPNVGTKDAYSQKLKEFFVQMRKNRKDIFEETTIADLLKASS